MPTWTPDPSFYPSPRMAMKAAPETLAYVAAFDPDRKTPLRDAEPRAIAWTRKNPGGETHSLRLPAEQGEGHNGWVYWNRPNSRFILNLSAAVIARRRARRIVG